MVVDGTWMDLLAASDDDSFSLLVADVRQVPDAPPVDAWLGPALRLLLPRHIVFVICEPRQSGDMQLGLRAQSQAVRSHIAWIHRNTSGPTDADLISAWDEILYLGTRSLHPSRRTARRRDAQVIPADESDGDSRHGAACKPAALMQWLIEMGSRPGESVLDLFGGDNATVKACRVLDRHCATAVADPLLAERLRSQSGHAVGP